MERKNHSEGDLSRSLPPVSWLSACLQWQCQGQQKTSRLCSLSKLHNIQSHVSIKMRSAIRGTWQSCNGCVKVRTLTSEGKNPLSRSNSFPPVLPIDDAIRPTFIPIKQRQRQREKYMIDKLLEERPPENHDALANSVIANIKAVTRRSARSEAESVNASRAPRKYRKTFTRGSKKSDAILPLTFHYCLLFKFP